MQVSVPPRCRLRAGIAAVSIGLLLACGGGGDSQTGVESRQFASQASTAAPLAPLTVTGSVPGDGGNNAARTLQPAFTFSSLLNAASVQAGNFGLRAASAGGLATPASAQVVDRVARLVPDNRLLPQTQYTVRAEPGIQDRAGQTLAEPVQKTFTTADAAWKEPFAVDTHSLTGERPHVAMDPKGNSWAAWIHQDYNGQRLLVSRFDAARGSWSLATELFGGPYIALAEPQLGMDRAGNTVLVWQARFNSGGSQRIWATRHSALTGAWETPRPISDDEPSNVYHDTMPRLALRSGGEVTVVWRRARREAFVSEGVYAAATSAEGGGWTSRIRIDDPDSYADDAVTSLAVALAPEPGRRLAITWVSGNGATRSVWSSVFHGHSAWPWVPPVRIADVGTDTPSDAGVSVDGRGDVFVIWRRHVPGTPIAGDRLWTTRFDGSAWAAPRLLAGANDFGYGAHIATSANPSQPATWVTWLTTGQRVMATQLRAAGPDAPRLIGTSPHPLHEDQFSRHVVDAAGNVLVGWTTGSGADARVMAARYVARLGAWQTVRQLDQHRLRFPYSVALAVGAAGDAIAVWQEQEIDELGHPTRQPVLVRRFD